MGGQQVVEFAIPEQHDLDVERYGLGIECLGRDQARRFHGLLDADLAGLDRALQGFPRERREQQPARVEQQIAAVGLVQRARLDQQKVGDQRAHLGEVLDAPHQVAVGRIVFLHQRSAAGCAFAVRCHDVDHVAAKARVVRGVDGLLDDGVLFLAGGQEQADVAHHVVARRLEIGRGFGNIAQRGVQVVQRVANGGLGHVLVELAQLRAALLVGPRQPLEHLPQLLLERRDLGLDVAAHGFRQGIEHLGLHHLAFVHGRHGEARRRAQQGNILALRLLAQPLQRFLVAGTELLVDGAPPRLVVVALEARRQHVAQLVERRDHALGQGFGAAMRQLQRFGAIGSFEVVDIGPIGRRREILPLSARDGTFTAVVLPEAGGPSTNKLKSWLLILTPN